MSAGISGSYTVLSAATMSAVSCSSSSGGIDEPGTGVAVTGIGSVVTSGVSAVLVSIVSSILDVIPAKAGIHATIVLAPDAAWVPACAGMTLSRHPKKSRALISASARASTSALVLYMANEARQVAVTPS